MLINEKPSFFLKVFANPLIKVYAPSQIRVELFATIKKKFPKEKATKDFDLDICFQKAEELLKNVIIRDDLDEKSLDKAKAKLKDRDLDDVSFLALTFQIEGEGILTNDKDIKDQSEVKAWKLGEAGRLVSSFKKGAFSFSIVSISIEPILKALGGILMSIWNSFLKIIEGILTFALSIVEGGARFLLNMPPEIAGIIGIGIFLLLLFDETREASGELLKIIGRKLNKLLIQIRIFFKDLIEVLKTIFEALKPILLGFGELYLYFMLNSFNTMNRLEKIE